jgi:hypothetical protein
MLMEAVPTEYKGIRYRSKSEAMFARYLELRNDAEFISSRLNVGQKCGAGGFIYEPKFLLLDDGWTPDFLWWAVYGSVASEPTLHASVVEYKPKVPTKTYLDAFLEHTQRLWGSMSYSPSYELYYGNFFTGTCGLFHVSDGRLEHVVGDEANWLEGYQDTILKTRFDLEAA